MKLPKRDEKFVVSRTYEGEECSFYGVVVSGVHIEIWGDDNKPDFIWYYVCADKVDDRFLFGRCLHVALCLEHALDFIARYLIPYQEQEEKLDGEPASETADSSDEGIISERDGGNELSGSMPDDLPCEDCHRSFCSGSAAPSSDDIPLGCMLPEVVAAVNHMSDSFNSLAADLLHLQHVLTPALSGTGGAAYA